MSAYIDAKATHIESLKLNAVDRLVRARDSSGGALEVTLDGQRHSRKTDAALFAGLGLAPAVLAAYAGWSLNGPTGALVGGALGLATFTAPAGYFLGRSLKAAEWTPESRWRLRDAPRTTPEPVPGPNRLHSLVKETGAENPTARQVLFISGHGDRKTLAGMSLDEIQTALQDSPVDITILDACLQGQLEVMSRLSPWAGLVLASPHKIKARGLELEELLSPSILAADSPREMAVAMAGQARSTTPSFAVIDTRLLKDRLLPSLDDLGSALAENWSDPELREKVDAALSDSISTDGVFSRRRVDLGSFLSQLGKQEIEAAKPAIEAFQASVPFQKNEHTLSFHLQEGRTDETLPAGWRDFLSKLDRSFKPF